MLYSTLLKCTLIPTISLFLFSFISTALTAHYWVLGDWVAGRFIEIPKDGFSLERVVWMIQYVQSPTDATIISVGMGLLAGVVGILAWYKLRRQDMDLAHNLPRRRFWVGFVVITSMASVAASLTALVLHYTQKGPDEHGCSEESDGRGGKVVWCTREMGACNVLPAWIKMMEEEYAGSFEVKNPSAKDVICGETQAVKWLQILIMLNGVAIIGMFAAQAWLRKKTRYQRLGKETSPDESREYPLSVQLRR